MTSFDVLKTTNETGIGQWEEVREEEDFYSKNALNKLDD
jgi:hypothetical protein